MIIKKKKSFTLIELVITITILGLLVASSAFFLPFFKLLFYPSKQLEVVQAANTLVDYVIEGNPYFSGLRSSKKITGVMYNYFLRFNDANSKDIALLAHPAWKEIRYVVVGESTSWQPLLYYASEKGIKLEALENDPNFNQPVYFKYRDEHGEILWPPISDLTKIKTIELNWLVYSGDGDISKGDGRTEVHTAIDLRQFPD